MFNHSVRRWIPNNLNNRELVQQFADAIDWLLSVDYPDSDKLADRFNSIRNKYINLQDVPIEDVYAIINESGYSYITDILSLSDDSLRTFVSFLNFIHQNKGTKRGLEFVFKLLQMDYEITEWFDMTPIGEPMTFNINLLSFSPNNIGGLQIINKLIVFCHNYVYPVLTNLTVQFNMDSANLSFAGVFQGTVELTFTPEIKPLIWDSDDYLNKSWT